jgi:predicted enzyme related to lactoylglutathione lyase
MDLLINIDVDDLPKAIAFYEQAIGVHVGRRFGTAGVEMLGASSPIYLLVKAEGSKPSVASDDVRR